MRRPPRRWLFLLDRDDAINAFAAGWEQQDSVVAVTRGALERLCGGADRKCRDDGGNNKALQCFAHDIPLRMMVYDCVADYAAAAVFAVSGTICGRCLPFSR